MKRVYNGKINYLILKIIGALLCVVGIVFMIIAICNYGNHSNDLFATFSMSGLPFLFAGCLCVYAGFRPRVKKKKNQQKTVYKCKKCEKIIDSDSVYCKHCGDKQ